MLERFIAVLCICLLALPSACSKISRIPSSPASSSDSPVPKLSRTFANFACPSGATYFIAKNGNNVNDGKTSTTPWLSTDHAFSHMKGGDRLVFLPGTYGSTNPADPDYRKAPLLLGRYIAPPNGTPSCFTTVQGWSAYQESLGAGTWTGDVVTVGGTYDQTGYGDYLAPINVDGPPPTNPAYLWIDGFVMTHQTSGAQINSGHHIVLSRVGFEGAGDGNTTALGFTNNSGDGASHHILVENFFVWGDGREHVSTFHARNIVFRNGVIRFDRATENVNSGNEFSFASLYSSFNGGFYNVIALDADHPEFYGNYSYLGGAFHSPCTSGLSFNIDYRNDITVNNVLGLGVLADNTGAYNTRYKNVVGWHLPHGAYTRTANVTYDYLTLGDLYGPTAYNLSIPAGMVYSAQNDPASNVIPSITNSILTYVNGTAITNFAREDYNSFNQNTGNLSNTSAGGHSVSGVSAGLKNIIEGGTRAGVAVGARVVNQAGVSGTFMGDGVTAYDADYTGNTTSGSKTITGISPAIGSNPGQVNLAVGMEVRGPGIAQDAEGSWPIISSINAAASTITISRAATATASGVALHGDPTEGDYNKDSGVSLWPWAYEDVIKRFMQAYTYTGPTFDVHGIADGHTATLSGDRGFASSTATRINGGPVTLSSYLWEMPVVPGTAGTACPAQYCP